MSFFRLPTHVRIQPGCLAELPEVLQARGAARVLLVTDPVLSAVGFVQAAVDAVRAAGLDCQVFAEVEPNPRVTTVERIAATAKDQRAEAIVGVGGGSVLDAAKGAAMLAANEGDLLDYVGKDLYANEPLPFVAVPTTCGTGSEVTWVSVITAADAGTKVSIKGLGMFPDVALVDADLLADLPPHLIASTSMDALTHAIEAMTGRIANPTSDALAEQAIERIFDHLEHVVSDPRGQVPSRNEIACAATLAGMAFGNSDVGAVHCLSETLGGLFDVPHGLANAILLAPVQRYQLESSADVYARLEARVSRRPATADAAVHFLERIERLGATVGIPSFSSLDIPRDRYDEIARRSVENGSNDSCPQPMAAADYRAILDSLA